MSISRMAESFRTECPKVGAVKVAAPLLQSFENQASDFTKNRGIVR